jgi:chromosome segregation ATPase
MTEETQDDAPATYRHVRALWEAHRGLWSALSKQAEQISAVRKELLQEAGDRINEDSVARSKLAKVSDAVKRHNDEIGELAGDVMRRASSVAELQVRVQELSEKVDELQDASGGPESRAEGTNQPFRSPPSREDLETLNERLRALWDVVSQEIAERKTHAEKALSLAKVTREDFAEAEERTDNRIVQINQKIGALREEFRDIIHDLSARVKDLEPPALTPQAEPEPGSVIIIREIAYQRSHAEGDKRWRSTASSRVYSWDEIKDEPYKVVWTP